MSTPHRTSRPAPAARLTVALVLGLLLAACSLPFQDDDSGDDPPELGVSSTTTPTTTADDGAMTPTTTGATADPAPAGDGDVVIGEAVYDPTFPPDAGDGWSELPSITYDSAIILRAATADRSILTVPGAVAFAPDQYVEVTYDQGAIADAPADGGTGAACRFSFDDTTYYALDVVRHGAGTTPGTALYSWKIYAYRADDANETVAESEALVEAPAAPLTVGLACTDHADGVQLDARIGGSWVGGTIDTEPLPGDKPGVYVTANESAGAFRVVSFTVFATSREG